MSEPAICITKPEPAAHTPGPWEARCNSSNYWEIWDSRHQIADTCASLWYDGADEEANYSLSEANARLIAHAPALLAHAEKSLNWLVGERDCFYEGCANPGSGYVHGADDRAVLDSLDRDIDELRALIKACKGEA